jgi:hypothetical protein
MSYNMLRNNKRHPSEQFLDVYISLLDTIIFTSLALEIFMTHNLFGAISAHFGAKQSAYTAQKID